MILCVAGFKLISCLNHEFSNWCNFMPNVNVVSSDKKNVRLFCTETESQPEAAEKMIKMIFNIDIYQVLLLLLTK